MGEQNGNQQSPPTWAKGLDAKLSDELDDLIARNEKKPTALTDTRRLAKRQLNFSALRDECQVRVIGSPVKLNTNLPRAAELVLLALGFSEPLPIVRSTRLWVYAVSQPYKDTSSGVVSNVNTFVFQLTNPIDRDNILRRSGALADLNANTIFGGGSQLKGFLRTLWPKAVYKLLVAASAKFEVLGYSLPIVSNLFVCIRKTPQSFPTPILTLEELDTLQPLVP